MNAAYLCCGSLVAALVLPLAARWVSERLFHANDIRRNDE